MCRVSVREPVSTTPPAIHEYPMDICDMFTIWELCGNSAKDLLLMSCKNNACANYKKVYYQG